MIKTDCLILGRGDLIGSKKNIDIKEIEYTDFNFREPFIKSSVVLFVDNSLQTKILKNRYGDHGDKIDHQREEQIKKMRDSILNMCVQSTGDSGMGGECPFCGNSCKWDDSLFDIEHEPDCVFLIARDLKTKI